MAGFTISCDECIMRDTETCDDCVVSFILRRALRQNREELHSRRKSVNPLETITPCEQTPLVTSMRVVPVAGHDSMLLNLSGAHGPSPPRR